MVTSASRTGLGLVMGAIALRFREGAVLGNVLFCVRLVLSGVNVAVADLPGWMGDVGSWLPLTHGIRAARGLADGASVGDVTGLMLREIGVGSPSTVLGLPLVGWLEDESRRRATLERT